MNYERIEKYSLISVVVLSAGLFAVGYDYALGMLLGGLAGLLSFKMIQRLENVSMLDYRVLKSKLRRNHLLRYLIYSIVLLGCFLRPNTFSFITCLIGLLITKVWIVIVETKLVKER